MNKQERTKNKRGVAVGLTAGLIGGTAAGLVLGVPGLSGAADDGASVEPSVGIVQQVDEPEQTDTVAPDREPGSGIREMLQALVDDGTLTAAQADAVATHMVENRPERGDRSGRGGPRHHGQGRFGGEVVTDLLGIDAETLRTELQGGATLVEVAAANGVSEEALVDALVADAMARIDQAVVDGKIDATTAAEKSADLEERVTARVNGERPERPEPPAADGG
jgi:hypothetical protein